MNVTKNHTIFKRILQFTAFLPTDFLIDGRRIGLFRGAKNYDWVAGTWDPNYTPEVDFLDHVFYILKNLG